jgi:hypothetical protein
VTFTVHASRGEDVVTTVRLSVVVAIAKGLALAEEGWQVFIIGPDGAPLRSARIREIAVVQPRAAIARVIQYIITARMQSGAVSAAMC